MTELENNPQLRQTAVVRRIFCFIFGCRIENRKCTRCASEFGVPKMSNPPKPPKRLIPP